MLDAFVCVHGYNKGSSLEQLHPDSHASRSLSLFVGEHFFLCCFTGCRCSSNFVRACVRVCMCVCTWRW